MINKSLIAPCGMNCGICLAFLRDKNRCSGCREDSIHKPGHCKKCVIINCEKLAKTDSNFCYDCEKYPCSRLKRLDNRYRTKYGMSMLDNLNFIKENKMEKFLENEQKRWTCDVCGSGISVHRDFCLNCKTKLKE